MHEFHDVCAQHTSRRILVTGATGYVGGRLVPALLHAGFTVRAMSRKESSLKRFSWYSGVETVEADLTDRKSMENALEGVDVVYYLVHSMGGKNQDFEKTEAKSARTLAAAAQAQGGSQIIYLSGLHPKKDSLDELSPAVCAVLPAGVLGLAYWWGVAPFHRFIFPAMARNILNAAKDKPLHLK